ncbi:MAG: CoA-binding protein [Flavobacteriales bacterium]|nr:CoA-binding protein [Flavobacteriales bacterium]
MKTTLVLGASTKVGRYSNKAMFMLKEKGHNVVAVGNWEGTAYDIEIVKEMPTRGIDTVTMYLGAKNQKPYYDQLLSLKPRRIIFNPGAENAELADLAAQNSIQVEEACTLVLLSIGNY